LAWYCYCYCSILLLISCSILCTVKESHALSSSPTTTTTTTKNKINVSASTVTAPPSEVKTSNSNTKSSKNTFDDDDGDSSTALFPSSRICLNGVEHYIRDTGDPILLGAAAAASEAQPSLSVPLPPVALLLHGFTGSTDSWEDVAPLLYQKGVRAIAIDRVGFGRTERPTQTALVPSLLPNLLSSPIPSFVREPVASMIEALPLPPLPKNDIIKDLTDILPPPNALLATAIRRPSLLSPKLPWTMSSKYNKMNPYSSEFAVSTLWPLLQGKLLPSSSTTTTTKEETMTTNQKRNVYFVGHSAGGPIAVQAFLNALNDVDNNQKDSDNNALLVPAGVVLIAPAILDPEEDPGIYEYNNNMDDNENNNSSNNNNDEDTIERNNNSKKVKDDSSSSFNFRRAVFKTVLSLPDAFGVPIVRRIYDGRNITEALLNQTYNTDNSRRSPATIARDDEGESKGANSSRSSRNKNNGLSVERANYLAKKYKSPVDEFPTEWDVGLLNVYRADFLKEDETDQQDTDTEKQGSSTTTNNNKKGRDLLCTVRDTVCRLQPQQLRMRTTSSDIVSDDTEPDVSLYRHRPSFCVVSGDDDRVVPARASRRVADILLASSSSSSLIGKEETESKSEENNTTSLSPLSSPSTVYYEIEGTGHLPMDEKPEEMAKVLLEFIL